MQVTRVFANAPLSAQLVRRFVRGTLGDTPHTDTAVLLASELAANAIEYSHGDFEVGIRSRPDGTVRVSVSDNSDDPPSLGKTPAPYARRGRGLHIVEALSAEWGVESTSRGNTVWFAVSP
jgi:anti-sigma regulatory factor (Ser/Thr protein kinase)